MEKVQINNQVISMRKLVKQAKVHIINKLVKQVKQLQSKKGDDAKITKFQRKAERLLTEINLIKKTNVDAVSKEALLCNKNWKDIVLDKTVSLDERAMARLISFDAVQKAAEQFGSKFPHLLKILPDLIQEWEAKKHTSTPGVKLKASELRKKKKEKKKHKSMNHTVSVTPVVKQKPEQLDEQSDSSQSLDETQQCERLVPDDAPECDSSSECEEKKQSELTVNHESQDHRNSKPASRRSLNKDHPDKGSYKKEYREKSKKHAHLKKSFQKNDGQRKKSFSGLGNRNDRMTSKQGDLSQWSQWRGTGANSIPVKKRKTSDFDVTKKMNGLKYQKDATQSQPKISSIKNAGKKTSVSLHPSWEAKRKMKEQANNMRPFQGKKIVFDE